MSYFHESSDVEIKEKVVKIFGKTLESFEKDVEDVRVWLKTQPHLPQVLTVRQIESYIILCKGDVDKVKSKIDMYFTMRGRFPDVFLNSHPLCERMKQAQKYIWVVPIPKLCRDLSRLSVVKIRPTDDPTGIDLYACFALLVNTVEIRFFEDICCGHTTIFDLEHVKMGHVMKLTPMLIKTMFIICEKALTTRLTAIHLVNAPSFIDQTVLIVKSVVNSKLGDRIIVHKGTDSAVKTLDREVLPSDYGGDQKSLEELKESFMKKFDDYMEFFDQREDWKVDEDLRPEKCRDDGFFGRYGNFKQLEVD